MLIQIKTQFKTLLQPQTLRHKPWLAVSILIIATLIIAIPFTYFLYPTLKWNLANVWLTHARLANTPTAMYDDAHRALKLLTPFAPLADSRIQLANHLLWRSASALDKSEEALSKYAQIFTATENLPTACPIELPQILEASRFDDVQPQTMVAPRQVSNSPYLGAILFTGIPISHQVCVEEAGIYNINVAAVHSTPPPIQIEILWDNMYVGTLSYEKGDQTLATQALQIATPAGNHMLTLNYANDYANKATGVDRNAIIDHVEISGP